MIQLLPSVRTMQMFFWTTWLCVLLIQRIAARFLVEQCGAPIVHSHISNGRNAEEEAAAWMAAIRNEEQFQCGGTVIHRRFVLTAAHCIENQRNLFVKLDAYNKSDSAPEYTVSTAVMHHGYTKRQMQHDVGLLKLSQDIQFGLGIYPICISLNPAMKNRVHNMYTFEAYGWGKTKTSRDSELLQKVTLNRLDRYTCDQYIEAPITSNQLCVGSAFGGDSCRGDSGGPLTRKFTVNGQILQIQLAIVSFGRLRCDGVGIYTDVSSYADWIERTIVQHQSRLTTGHTHQGYLGRDEGPQFMSGHPNRPPPGFSMNPSPPSVGSWNRSPSRFAMNPPSHRFPTSQPAMFLYDECSGDEISLKLPVKIDGVAFEGKGVMITNRYVLTNAKDLPSDTDSLEVSIVADNLFEVLAVESIIKPPGGENHDIALLKLTSPALFSGKRKPICMLLQARHRQQAARSVKFTIFDSRESEAIPLDIYRVDSSECSTRINREIKPDQLCFEEPKTLNKDGQTGDVLGKKILYKGKDLYILFGIVSYSKNGLIIATNVLKYTDWIADIVKND